MTLRPPSRLLIVDDEPVVLESCRRVLEEEGLAVTVSRDAFSAERILVESGPFDLLICDIKMPGMDGFQLIRRVRNHCGDMAVLIMTGYLTPETVAAGKSSGASAFLAKPFTPEELLAVVCETMGRTISKQRTGGVDE